MSTSEDIYPFCPYSGITPTNVDLQRSMENLGNYLV
jgi:hypothetical protein